MKGFFPLFPQNPFRNHFPHFAFCNLSPLSSHLLLSSHTHAVHTPKQTMQNQTAWSDFFVRTARAGAAPSRPIPSLPLFATSLPPSLGFAGKQHVLTSKSKAREDQLLILHSSTIRAEEIQESHNILHIHHNRDQAMLTFRRKTPLLFTYPISTMFCSRALDHWHNCLQVGTLAKQGLKGSTNRDFQVLSFHSYTWSPLQG